MQQWDRQLHSAILEVAQFLQEGSLSQDRRGDWMVSHHASWWVVVLNFFSIIEGFRASDFGCISLVVG